MADTTHEWTVETLREYLIALVDSNDRKYSDRFMASQDAVNAAFITQQTAMQTALVAQKLAVDTALAAADRAVAKAEIATEKRFEAVNEFRAVLTSQQVTFVTHNEVNLMMRTLTEKVDLNTKGIADMQTAVANNIGQKSGIKESWVYVLGGVSILTLVASVILHFLPT